MKENNKWICVLAYIIFFIPIIIDSKNEEYKFHANQGFNLLLLSIIISLVGILLPFIGWFIILPLGGLFCFILAVIGVINAINEKMKELPLIGKYRLIN
jgi:uncharacterized membrane protein